MNRLRVYLLFFNLSLVLWPTSRGWGQVKSNRPIPLSTSQYQLSLESQLKLQYQLRQSRPESFNVPGAPAPLKVSDLKGFNELLPFVSPSPDQEDAGTCLFMSLTGIAEWWLAKINNTHFIQDGPVDLSERWWMNLNGRLPAEGKIKNWITDTIYLFNQSRGALNNSYRYTKGWVQLIDSSIIKSSANAQGAQYSPIYNWLDEIDLYKPKTVTLPSFQRTILFQDGRSDPWSFGHLSSSSIETVKQVLRNYKAPVQVVYNHLGYWHSVFIVGYDDNLPTYDCYFIQETKNFYKTEMANTLQLLNQAKDSELKSELQKKHELLVANANKLNHVHQANGGCKSKGMFYVRDSQYPDGSEELYKYELSNPQSFKPYAKRIILREYNWLSDLASHGILITTTHP